jgi:RNA polymerase sigma-70 factor (ECF subfamily)
VLRGPWADGPAPGAPSDADLVRAHVAGDPHAFGELVRRHRDRLWAVALRTTRDPEEAADALQDALLSAHRAAERFRGESAVTTWLHRIVVNACLDRLRRQKTRATVPFAEDGSDEPAVPYDATERSDTQMLVHEALLGLPEDQRAAIVAVDVEGYSVADAAAALGVAEGTVKSRCARGRAKLAVALGHLAAERRGHLAAERRGHLAAERRTGGRAGAVAGDYSGGGNRAGSPGVTPSTTRAPREGP